MGQKRPADIFAEALDYLWDGLGLEEKGWTLLNRGTAGCSASKTAG